MNRKASKNTRSANSFECAFQKWLKNHQCVISGQTNVQVHHCKGSAFKRNKVLIGHWFCLPLSEEMHSAYHANTKSWRKSFGPQCELWSSIATEYLDETGFGPPSDVINSILHYGK